MIKRLAISDDTYMYHKTTISAFLGLKNIPETEIMFSKLFFVNKSIRLRMNPFYFRNTQSENITGMKLAI